MSGSRYVAIVESEFRGFIETQMGFSEVEVKNCHELVWDRKYDDRYSVRVFSTISGGESRSSGQDAIRCVLFDGKTGRVTKVGARVHRTKSALPNMRERCRDIWRLLKSSPRCSCGGVMVEREGRSGKFRGCSCFPACKNTMAA
jgi:hypothetical protein